ncbi:hypothetical protein [Flavobacterium sp. WC2430]|uniref:hypothetical protein n=1 Tax=Flavobacterium sp. WC2430 TaxID=3234137 RepID=UPI00346500E7
MLKLIVLADGNAPQATVVLAGAVIVGKSAGLIVIVLDTDATVLPQASVAVQVSVTAPPQASGVALNVDGFDVPLIKQPPLNPLLKLIVLDDGNAPQATVVLARAVIVGKSAGLIVIVLDTDATVLPQASVAVQVSITAPPQASGVALNVDGFDVPLIKQPPLNPLLKLIVLDDGNAPQATVVLAGAVIVGKSAGLTVIVLDTEATVLPQTSVAVQVSITAPPQASGVALNVDGFDVPLIKQPPLNPLLKLIVLADGNAPQATVVLAGAVIVGKSAGLIVIVLDTDATVLPQASVAVQVSVTAPPQASGVALNVDGFDVPLIKQPPLNPLLKLIVLDDGNAPQATVMAAGAVIVGKSAGLIVIVLDTEATVLPQASVAVQVSVTAPPQASGVALNVDGFDVPLIKQPPLNPLLKLIVLADSNAPQATVMAAGAVIVGKSAGLIVIVLDTDATVLPQASVAVQVSVTAPPQASGVALNVDGFDVPLIKQPPLNPLLKLIVLADSNAPQATVMAAGAVIVGKSAGLIVIVLDTDATVLPQASVAVQVSVTAPPQASGVALNVDGFDVPLIKQPPLNPLLKLIVLADSNAPQATVVLAGAVIVGKSAGLIVIVLDTDATVLPQASVAVQVSITAPPQASGVELNVDGFDVPLIKQPPLNPLLKLIVLADGNAPQATVILAGAVIVGMSAGLIVIVLDTDATVLPQASVAVQVSVTAPPQASGVALNVDGFDVPLIKQPPLNPLLKLIVLDDGNAPQATVVLARAVIVGKSAGLIVIVLDTDATVLPQASVAVQVSITAPPQASGVALNVDGFDVPLIKQPPLNPLLKLIVLDDGNAPQATVVLARAVIVGKSAGLIVIVLDTDATVLPQASVAVQVSITAPPQASGVALNVDGFDVPLIKQPPLNPLLKLIVLADGNAPQATVVLAGAVIVGKSAGLTVIVLDTEATVLPQASVAVQVSVTAPPQASGVALNVDGFDVPLIKQPPLNPLLKLIVLADGNAPQATVMVAGAVIVGKSAGLIVIVLDTDATVLPQASVAVQVSVTAPPQASGVALNVDGFDVPLIKQPPLNPLLKLIVLADGNAPQATVILAGAVIVGMSAGLIVIVLDTDATVLPQASVAVQVSVTAPPQASGVALNVDGFDVPLIKQPPLNPLLKLIVLDDGNAPQATVVLAGAVIVGKSAGLIVIN